MKKKLNLKLILGILFVVLLVLLVIFFINKNKSQEENGEKIDPSVDMPASEEYLKFYDQTYSYWVYKLSDYLMEKRNEEATLRDTVINDDGNLVITFKNYDSKKGIGPDGVVIVEEFTISRVDGSIVDSKGNTINLAELKRE